MTLNQLVRSLSKQPRASSQPLRKTSSRCQWQLHRRYCTLCWCSRWVGDSLVLTQTSRRSHRNGVRPGISKHQHRSNRCRLSFPVAQTVKHRRCSRESRGFPMKKHSRTSRTTSVSSSLGTWASKTLWRIDSLGGTSKANSYWTTWRNSKSWRSKSVSSRPWWVLTGNSQLIAVERVCPRRQRTLM